MLAPKWPHHPALSPRCALIYITLWGIHTSKYLCPYIHQIVTLWGTRTHLQIFVPWGEHPNVMTSRPKRNHHGLVCAPFTWGDFSARFDTLAFYHFLPNLQSTTKWFYLFVFFNNFISLHCNTYRTIDQRGLQFFVLCINLFLSLLE